MVREDVIVLPQPWLWQPRFRAVRFLEIHATRGPTSPEQQFAATVNWLQSPGNGSEAQGWGSSCSYVIDRDGTLAVVLLDDEMPTYSAGYGGPGSEWSIDEYGISYEWCQSPAQEEFTTAQYERAAIEFAIKCVVFGIPPVMLDIARQAGAVPAGFVRHDRCENGRKLGKSDPGPKFRDDDFVALVRDVLAEEEPMRAEDIDARVTELVNEARGINARFVRADGQDEVWEIVHGRRVWLVTPEVAFARGVKHDLSNVEVINAVQLLAWPEGQL